MGEHLLLYHVQSLSPVESLKLIRLPRKFWSATEPQVRLAIVGNFFKPSMENGFLHGGDACYHCVSVGVCNLVCV